MPSSRGLAPGLPWTSTGGSSVGTVKGAAVVEYKEGWNMSSPAAVEMSDGKVWMVLVEVGEEYLRTVVVSGEFLDHLYCGCQVWEEEAEEFPMLGRILEIAFEIMVVMWTGRRSLRVKPLLPPLICCSSLRYFKG
jgi:hypothetical protein